MKLSDFDFELPERYIAQNPVKPRSYSKLLINNFKTIKQKRFYNLKDYLSKGDVIVINNSKVKKSKIIGNKITGSPIEIIIIEKENEEYKCRITGKNIKSGSILIVNNKKIEVTKKINDIFWIKFIDKINEKYIEKFAIMPLPPYVKEKLKIENSYQTVYAKEKGSLAAPTAGLHFTPNLIKELKKKGVIFAEVCLHVGFGTFLPVRHEDITQHKMENEKFYIDEKNANIINNRKGKLFIVGTTSLRALESSADKKGKIIPGEKSTELFIYPGYKFKLKPDAFITNFHLPKSTLIMLLCGLIGKKEVLKSYEFAKKNNFRFYSFGDSSLFLMENSQPQ
jgi:S-adenosylmethionine:tRNA ribosyltransferase-isomerase